MNGREAYHAACIQACQERDTVPYSERTERTRRHRGLDDWKHPENHNAWHGRSRRRTRRWGSWRAIRTSGLSDTEGNELVDWRWTEDTHGKWHWERKVEK